jgi:H+/Cl- antiporter ClcA
MQVEDLLAVGRLTETAHLHAQHWGVSRAPVVNGTQQAHQMWHHAATEVSGGPRYGSELHSLGVVLLVRFVMTAVAITLPLPCGLYTPLVVIGAAAGRIYGMAVGYVLGPSVHWGVYAVAGAAAFPAGATRAVSTAVFVFELTGSLGQLLPVLTSVVCAIGVGMWMLLGEVCDF